MSNGPIVGGTHLGDFNLAAGDVRRWGAFAGLTDEAQRVRNHVAFQAALDNVLSVYVPEGRWEINGDIRFNNRPNVLWGDGRCSEIVDCRPATNTPFLTTVRNVDDTSASGQTVRNLKITCASAAPYSRGVLCEAPLFACFEHVCIEGFYRAGTYALQLGVSGGKEALNCCIFNLDVTNNAKGLSIHGNASTLLHVNGGQCIIDTCVGMGWVGGAIQAAGAPSEPGLSVQASSAITISGLYFELQNASSAFEVIDASSQVELAYSHLAILTRPVTTGTLRAHVSNWVTFRGNNHYGTPGAPTDRTLVIDTCVGAIVMADSSVGSYATQPQWIEQIGGPGVIWISGAYGGGGLGQQIAVGINDPPAVANSLMRDGVAV